MRRRNDWSLHSVLGIAEEMNLDATMCRFVVAFGDELPFPATNEPSEESAGVLRADDAGVLGRRDEVQAVAFGVGQDLPFRGLFEELKQTPRVLQVFGNDLRKLRFFDCRGLRRETRRFRRHGGFLVFRSRREF